MCIVCRHPDRIAIEAALEAGRPLRAVAVDYPGLNKSTIGRHRKECMIALPAATPFAPGCNGEPAPQSAPTLPTVRRRTRPIDEAQRLDIALRMKARGCTRADIARAIGVSPGHVGEIVRRATDNAVELVRSQTVEELVAQHRAERHARVQALHAVLAVATLRNDARTIIEVTRELRHEAKEDREWMRELGAFDHFRIKTYDERQQSDGHSPDGLIDMAKQLFGALATDEPVAALSAIIGEADAELSLTPAGTTD